MGYFTDPNNNFTVYDVPKGGGTTILSWISYAGTGDLLLEGNGEYYHASNHSYSLLDEWGYSCDYFKELDGERICVKRDPIKRFISCYKDKVIKENRMPGVSIEDLIDNFHDLISRYDAPHPSNKNIGYLAYHFAPQAEVLGDSKDYYTHIFDISEISTSVKTYLESKWEIDLPNLHCRNSGKSKSPIELSEEYLEKLRDLYSIDYDTGWF